MALSPSDELLFYGDFEADGEAAVRANLALGRYQPKKRALAEEWLRRKEEERAGAARTTEMEIAHSAKEAAWEAARAAQTANTIAKAAAAIAVLAAIVAVVMPFLRK